MPRKRPLIGDVMTLQQIVDALNEGETANPRLTHDDHTRLLRKVRSWLESGRDVSKMEIPLGEPSFWEEQKSMELKLVPGFLGKIQIIPTPALSKKGAVDVAAIYFMWLILNPLYEKLGGPCLNCDRWYVKKSRRISLFCSRECSDKRKQAHMRNKQHKDKLERVMETTLIYRTRPARFAAFSWKQWVIKAVPGITLNFLTHAVNRGELKAPLEETN